MNREEFIIFFFFFTILLGLVSLSLNLPKDIVNEYKTIKVGDNPQGLMQFQIDFEKQHMTRIM